MSLLTSLSPPNAIASTDLPAQSTKTKDAAQQFEALLIASMLQSCRQQASWFGSGEDAGSDSAVGYAEEHLARALAAQGGLGIASTIVGGLESSNTQNRPYVNTGSAAAGEAKTTGATSSLQP